MNFLDITTYIQQQLGIVLLLMCLAAFFASFPIIMYLESVDFGEADKAKKRIMKVCVFLGILCFVVGLLPTHDNMLKFKISKIKNEAVNKENISKGVETLERIGEKLECKYLGCEDNND